MNARTSVPPDVEAPRLDVWLARQRGSTRHAARVLIDAELVLVNGRPGRPGQRIHQRDVVETREPAAEPEAAIEPAAFASLDVVYEDDSLAVIDKPAGLVVHPAPGHASGTLADMLRARGTTWSLLGGAERPGIVHRLDRDTSGLLVVAKTEAAHRGLAAQLQNRTLGRSYTAIVHGGFREETGSIAAPIGRDPRNRKRMAVVDGGRDATTDFRVAERLGGVSLLDVRLRTGRTHQIRVHLASIHHPVVGDALYGSAEPALGRPALHAAELTFAHPVSGEQRRFVSPLPTDIRVFLEHVRARP